MTDRTIHLPGGRQDRSATDVTEGRGDRPKDTLFAGPGEIRALCRSVDWSATPLGPVEKWPQSLRCAVRICLESKTAMCVWAGPELTLIHNEGYAPVLGVKYPRAMGRPLREVWSEVWDTIGPEFRQVVTEGIATHHEEAKFRLLRDGSESDAYFSYSLTPVREDDGRVVGVFNVVEETTLTVQARVKRDAQYKTLFDSIDEGFCVVQLIFDEAQRPVDYRFLEVNPAFEGHAGLTGVIGRTAREVLPRLEPSWIHLYGDVARTGEPRRYQDYVASMDRWFNGYAFPTGEPQEHKVAILFMDITERRRAEEALRESEARLRRLYESGMLGVLCFDLDGAITDANDKFLEMVGYTREDLCAGRIRWNEMTPPEYRAADEHAVAELRAAGLDTPYEKEYIRKDGTRLPIYIGAATFDHERHQGIAFVLDLTSRKNAEDALRDALDRLQIAADAANLGIYDCDVVSGAVQWDARVRSIWGVGADMPVTRESFLLGLHPEDHALTEAAVVRALDPRGEGRFAVEHRVIRPLDGRVRWLAATGKAFFSGGRAVRLVGTVQDITPRKQAEEALRASEAHFRIMGETIPYGVWLCNAQGGAEYASQSFLDLLEMTREEMREHGWTHRLAPEDVQPMLDEWMRCVKTGAPWDSEHRILGPDGEYHHVLTRGLPVRDESGNVTCWVGINLDIDARKAMEEQLREADRRKTEFLAVLSHELRNPLTPIKNSLYILDRAAPGGEQASRAKEIINRQVNQLTNLVNDLLDVTRISRNKVRLQKETLDLNETVRRTVEDNRSLFEKSRVHLEVALAPSPIPVNADRTRIAQVVSNLLQNAAKFTPAGGHTRVAVTAGDHKATVRVADDGVGMSPEMRERLFEPFAQAAQSIDRSAGGLGLGLALVKGLVELHGGAISARSEGPGKGSEFIVELPCEPAVAPQDTPAPAPTSSTRRRVLLIEDNLDAAESLREVLELGEHEVAVANDGPEGVRLARCFRPDVILCDIGLPGMDGYEVARALRSDDRLRGVRLVALSGYALPEDIQRAREAGFHEHLAKPPSIERLEDLLSRVPRLGDASRGGS